MAMIKGISFETINGRGEAIRLFSNLWEINAPSGMVRFHGTPGDVRVAISKIASREAKDANARDLGLVFHEGGEE